MKILIIGDYPLFIGGVTNYTRPLAQELSKNHEVFYLYNTSRTGQDSFNIGKKIVFKKDLELHFKCFELKNGNALYYNYDRFQYDYNDWFDKSFIMFIKRIRPDVVHINEIFGFSSRIIKILRELNINVFVTIHEYWWICPHRVMVDFNKRICDGPSDLKKCSLCVFIKKPNKTYFRIRTVSRIKNDFPKLFNILFSLVNKYSFNSGRNSKIENIAFLDQSWGKMENRKLEQQLSNRLSANINSLNSSNKLIAVSNDVKRTLIKFGTKTDKIIVQHIGTSIAENIIKHVKPINIDDIIIGFIGGISYYKGIHQLVEAYCMLPQKLKNKSRLKIFGKYDIGYYNAIIQNYVNNNEDYERINFFGKYYPEDIPAITNKIDIIVLPSLCADTAPQTIFESFSSGLPIIAPNLGGFPDFVTHEKNGLLYEAANVQSLKETLIRIITNPNLIYVFQKNIPKIKTISENVRELLYLYQEGL